MLCVRESQKSIAESAKRLVEDTIQNTTLATISRVLDKLIRTRSGGLYTFTGMKDHGRVREVNGRLPACVVEEGKA